MAEAIIEFPARLPWLGHLKNACANLYDVAKVHVLLGPSQGREVLAEGSRVVQDLAIHLRSPGYIVIKGIVVNRFISATMDAQVALFITLYAVRPYLSGDAYWRLGNGAARPDTREGYGDATEEGAKLDAGLDHRSQDLSETSGETFDTAKQFRGVRPRT
jgi:hypothetical protein